MKNGPHLWIISEDEFPDVGSRQSACLTITHLKENLPAQPHAAAAYVTVSL